MKKQLLLLIALFNFVGANALVTHSFKDTMIVQTNPASSKPYALVAGGSKGIGYSIAEALARRNYNIILNARHEDSLIAAKNRLEATYPIHVEIIVKDLAGENAAEEIAKWCTDKNIHLKMLCNVAGFGGNRDYLAYPCILSDIWFGSIWNQ